VTLPGEVVVRPAAAGDVERLVELYATVADEGRWLGAEGPVDRAELRQRWGRRLSSDDGVHLVADASGVVVGQVSLELAPYGVASLGMLVEGGWRRRGVGTALVQAAVDAARNRGCHKVSLQVWPHNQAAGALYRKLGFEDEGLLRHHYRRRNGELWGAVIMGLVLAGPASAAGQEVEDDRGHHRQHDRGGDRDVDPDVLLPEGDVAREPAETQPAGEQ